MHPGPKFPSIVIPPQDLGTIHHVGFIHDCVAMFGSSHADDKEDEIIRDSMLRHNVFESFDRHAFSRIRETHWGANKGVLKYGGPLGPPSISEDILKRARSLMFRFYEPYAGTCPVIPEDEVEMVFDTHCGIVYRVLGYKNKGEVLLQPVMRDEVIKSWYSPDYPTLWKISVKGSELLKRSKIESNDPRIFIVPDMKYHYWSIRMFYSAHELLKRLAQDINTKIKVGYVFQYGGFTRLMEYLARHYDIIVEGDVTKWDSAMWEFIVTFVLFPLYCKLHKPTEYCSQREYEIRLFYHFQDMLHSIMVMPSGQVLVKHCGNPSGQFITGDVNCIWHEFDIYLLYTLEDMDADLRRDQWWLLGDDHIFGTNNNKLAPFETRRKVYKLMGSDLSPDKDVVSHSVEGHTFLGFTAHFCTKRGRYVPVYNMQKALCSALKPGGKVDPALRYARLTGLRILTFFHPLYDKIKDVARDCYQEGLSFTEIPDDLSADTAKFLLSWPSDSTIERLWLGYEGSGSEGGLVDEGSLLTLVHFCA